MKSLPITNRLTRSINALGVYIHAMEVSKQLAARDQPHRRSRLHCGLALEIKRTSRLLHVR
jgi:hypothetical protein